MVRRAVAVLSVFALTSVAEASPGSPRPDCMMTVLAPATAIENPKAVMPKGKLWGPATQMRIGTADGHVSYCAHGDYCYSADHLRFVTPCTPDAMPAPLIAGDTERLYELPVRRSR